MADKPQNPPAEPMPQPADMEEMIEWLEHEFNNKLVKFKVACDSLHTFVDNKERFKRILNLCTELVVINRDEKLAKYLDVVQNRIAKCLQYYDELCELVNGAEWQKAKKHCEEMKNQKDISNPFGYDRLVVAMGVTILSWKFAGIVAIIVVVVGAVVSGVNFWYSSTCNSKTLEECKKAFQKYETTQIQLVEIQDELRRFWDIKSNDKEERKHILQDIRKEIIECTAKITKKNPPKENKVASVCKTVKQGAKTAKKINHYWS